MPKRATDSLPKNQIGVREIRQDASIILARVEEGEEFVITNRGVPVAKLIPIEKPLVDLFEEMIANGEIIEAEGNLWDLPLPTFR